MKQTAQSLRVDVLASPFRELIPWEVPAGPDCKWLVENAPDLVTRDPVHIVVLINDDEIPCEFWGHVRPKPGAEVSVLVVPKDDDAFSFATTALNVTSLFVGFINPFAGAALAIGGGLALSLFAPKPGSPGAPEVAGQQPAPNTAAGTGLNALREDGPLTSVAGTHRVTLPLLAPPYVDIVGDKEVVHLLGGLHNPHELEEIEVNGVDIDDFGEITFATDNGLSGNAPSLTIYDKIVIQESFDERFDIYQTDPNAGGANANRFLVDQNTPTTRPTKIIKTSGKAPNEIWLHFLLPDGLKAQDTTVDVGTAFTIEVRRKGETTFRKLPYIRMLAPANAQINQPFRFYVRLIFSADPVSVPTNIGTPWDEILSSAPQSVSTVGDDPGNQDWTADPYFDNAIDDQSLHVAEFADGLEIYLDPDDATDPWPLDQYEIRVDKGFTIGQNNLTTTLQGNSLYHNILDQGGLGILILPNASETNVNIGNMVWQRLASVWNEAPVTAPNLAYIELRGEAVRIDSLTALAKGYAPVWNGTDWEDLGLTDNPASYYRLFLTDRFHAEPLPIELLDDEGLGAWFNDNTTNSYAFNSVIEGGPSVENLLNFAALAGFAKTLRAEQWGVWLDKDRTSEAATQLLTPENINQFQGRTELENFPDALRISFRDAADEYRPNEKLIDKDGAVVTSGQIIKAFDATKIGKTTLAEIQTWGGRILTEPIERSNLFTCVAPVRSLDLKRGKMVAINHDVFGKAFSFGFVEEVFEDESGNATGLRLTHTLRLSEAASEDLYQVADLYDVDDLYNLSRSWGVAVEIATGTVRIEQINEVTDADVVTFVTPFAKPTGLKEGNWVGSGPLGQETKRYIIADIQPADNDTAKLALIDEAPGIH